MNITIKPPLSICQQGMRGNMEDSIYPVQDPGCNDHLFIVCDGVGGTVGGEMASRIVCDSIPAYFQERKITEISESDISYAIGFAQDKMNAFVKRHPQFAEMSTTLALLYRNPGYYTIAWIGDSRIYHIRKGIIQFKSKDHSMVQEMLDEGSLRREDIPTFPWKNVVTRVIGLISDIEAPDVVQIHDIQPGDYFVLCTDGILESVDDDEFCQILKSRDDNHEKINRIEEKCRSYSKDNYSLCLVQVDEVA